MSISEATSSQFTYLSPNREAYEPGRPILTIILDCYYRLDLVKQSIQSVLDQDYPNVELLLIDNGAHPDVSEYLRHIHENADNTPLIRFSENQFDWDDTEKAIAICWNAALIHAKGDYVAHLAYDDMISANYATRMVGLFIGDGDCVTAAPMPVSIDETGRINGAMGNGNTRGRYTDGIALAMEIIGGGPRTLFSAPGEIFAIKREILMRYGGYDRMFDLSQVLKFSILGSSGFDAEAALYWRHHQGQLNKQAKRKGVIWYASMEKAWLASGVVDLWKERFDAGAVKALLAYKEKQIAATPLNVVRENVRLKNLRGVTSALINMARECPALLGEGLYAAAREAVVIVFGKLSRALRHRG